MAASAVRVAYTADTGTDFHLPLLPVILQVGNGVKLRHQALLDTGAPVSVLPRSIGENLGLSWEQAKPFYVLSGGLKNAKTRGVVVDVTVARFASVRIGFAWAESDSAPLILGQVNFFQNFRICFYRAELAFDIRPEKVKPHP